MVIDACKGYSEKLSVQLKRFPNTPLHYCRWVFGRRFPSLLIRNILSLRKDMRAACDAYAGSEARSTPKTPLVG